MRSKTRTTALGAAALLGALATAVLAAPPAAPQYHRVDPAAGVNAQGTETWDISNNGTSVGDEGFPPTTCANGVEHAVIHGPFTATSPTPAPPWYEDNPGAAPAETNARAITQSGTLAVGWWRTPTDGCSTLLGPAAWELVNGTWSRNWIEEPLTTHAGYAQGIELVGQGLTPVASGIAGASPNQVPAVWRKLNGTWVRENLSMSGLTGVSAGDVQDDGLVVHDLDSAAVWNCSGSTCSAPVLLSATTLVGPGRAYDINDAGDVVGQGTPVGSGYARALVWRFIGQPGAPAWSNPTTLPDYGYGSIAYASEWVAGTLTVIGNASDRRNVHAVRWRLSGSTWGAPEKIADLDDSSSTLTGVNSMSASGNLSGPSHVDIRR